MQHTVLEPHPFLHYIPLSGNPSLLNQFYLFSKFSNIQRSEWPCYVLSKTFVQWVHLNKIFILFYGSGRGRKVTSFQAESRGNKVYSMARHIGIAVTSLSY